jgi:hypothetical protein
MLPVKPSSILHFSSAVLQRAQRAYALAKKVFGLNNKSMVPLFWDMIEKSPTSAVLLLLIYNKPHSNFKAGWKTNRCNWQQ